MDLVESFMTARNRSETASHDEASTAPTGIDFTDIAQGRWLLQKNRNVSLTALNDPGIFRLRGHKTMQELAMMSWMLCRSLIASRRVVPTSDENPVPRRQGSHILVLQAVTMGLLACICLVRVASAEIIRYAFDPGTSATFPGGDTEQISGTFVIDTSLIVTIPNPSLPWESLAEVAITLTGPGAEAGGYGQSGVAGFGTDYFDFPGSNTSELYVYSNSGPTNHTEIRFVFSGSLLAPGTHFLTPPIGVEILSDDPAIFATSFAGSVSPIAEPAPVYLLATSLGFLILVAQRKRSRHLYSGKFSER
jgi:hypothetical protein